jgi:predicted metal-dependent HD superfamily phosphohydrolase
MKADDFSHQYEPQWHAEWKQLAGRQPEAGLLAQLAARYSEVHRHYHTLQHLDACLRHLAGLRAQARCASEVAMALWFHDAIYDIGATDNESRSADWASAVLTTAGVPPAVADRVHGLIMVTRHDQPPQTPDQALLLDIDLAILGAPVAVFDGYEQQIFREYQNVPAEAFRSNRRRILQGFLDRPRIYHTPTMHEAREAQARENLQRSIQALAN